MKKSVMKSGAKGKKDLKKVKKTGGKK